MALVNYSESEAEGDDEMQTKKRKLQPKAKEALPPLPQGFRDLYSSTVRTSTTDDPALHGGRKRVVPHVQGNWPAHVYLEWCPTVEKSEYLSRIIHAAQQRAQYQGNSGHEIHSLLQDDLGVPLPLHVSLSRPLVLKTAQKDDFLDRVTRALQWCSAGYFSAVPGEVKWHPNEDHTRWFLVLQISSPQDQLLRLLGACNSAAKAFEQPSLYSDDTDLWPRQDSRHDDVMRKFHISLAWSLTSPNDGKDTAAGKPDDVSDANFTSIGIRRITFMQVKVRIGQDVTSIHLGKQRPFSHLPLDKQRLYSQQRLFSQLSPDEQRQLTHPPRPTST